MFSFNTVVLFLEKELVTTVGEKGTDVLGNTSDEILPISSDTLPTGCIIVLLRSTALTAALTTILKAPNIACSKSLKSITPQ
ncbi:hypothetical protein EDL79_04110 [Ehrlichia ruminantium]|uniref:Uncharacterized protein n=1 Tax=Ehrlichia ruminantium TaxID=779 RepID=A0AAE6Q9J6_EHRRU|nr:hypothetical protein [Ehrlichia ruminantium]QGR02797.1 hypothetical protein EDL81_04090 [Ehrlichia ruminantium]QGR03721.1 hypothetical protein EDL80_04100 [Ehrlichia ruminantium]QGR04648.1 hypothetical protein EDL79_04110 [Ehrlichia ruminantium]